MVSRSPTAVPASRRSSSACLVLTQAVSLSTPWTENPSIVSSWCWRRWTVGKSITKYWEGLPPSARTKAGGCSYGDAEAPTQFTNFSKNWTAAKNMRSRDNGSRLDRQSNGAFKMTTSIPMQYRRGLVVTPVGRSVSSPIISSPSSVVQSREAIGRRSYLKRQTRNCPEGPQLQELLEAAGGLKAEFGRGRRS